MTDTIQRDLDVCLRWPYHIDVEGKDEDWRYKPKDAAEHAALAILYDYSDRRGVKQGFYDVEEVVRKEIVETTASIIRAALAKEG